MFLNESPRCHIVLRASSPGTIISPSCFQADTTAFVNEYLTSAGNLTRCMLCVAQSLEHAQSSQFSAVSSSQPGSCACSLIVLRCIVTPLLQENRLLSREAASCLCSSGSIQVQVELIGRISTSTRLQARTSQSCPYLSKRTHKHSHRHTDRQIDRHETNYANSLQSKARESYAARSTTVT